MAIGLNKKYDQQFNSFHIYLAIITRIISFSNSYILKTIYELCRFRYVSVDFYCLFSISYLAFPDIFRAFHSCSKVDVELKYLERKSSTHRNCIIYNMCVNTVSKRIWAHVNLHINKISKLVLGCGREYWKKVQINISND